MPLQDDGQPRSNNPLETFSTDGDIDLHLVELSETEIRARFGSFAPGFSSNSKDDTLSAYRVEPILTQDSQGNGSDYNHQLQMEFNDNEVQQFVAENTKWRKLFKYPPTNDEKQHATKQLCEELQGRTVIASGLLNLDCVHNCHTELHPVFALAIRMGLENGAQDTCMRSRTQTAPRGQQDYQPR